MLSLSAEQIQQRIFTARADLADGVERIPLKTVHINKCPVLAPISVLRSQDLERLELDIELCRTHLQSIAGAKGLQEKLADVFTQSYSDSTDDPDLMIYSGGFFNDADRAEMDHIRTLNEEKLAHYDDNFYDARLPEMLFRYRARNYPETLNPKEQEQWLEHRRQCFNRLEQNGQSAQTNYYQKLDALKQDSAVNQQIIADLQAYAGQITSV